MKCRGIKLYDIVKAIKNIDREIPIYAVFLRGSYLNGKFTETSDIDLIIVTDFLSSFSQHVRRKILLAYFNEIMQRIDLLCITNSELKLYSKRPIFEFERTILIYKNEKDNCI